MSTAAQQIANRQNAQLSTGPRTEDGTAKSSQNALKLGLFSATDFVRPEYQAAYDEVVQAFWTELSPVGALEQTHVLEIIRASWRLQRCSQIEASLVDNALESGLDPMEDPAAIRTQNSVDRSRAQSNNTIRRATAELRRIQTERQTRAELAIQADPAIGGLADQSQILKTLHTEYQCRILGNRSAAVRLESELGITPDNPVSQFYRPPATEPRM